MCVKPCNKSKKLAASAIKKNSAMVAQPKSKTQVVIVNGKRFTIKPKT